MGIFSKIFPLRLPNGISIGKGKKTHVQGKKANTQDYNPEVETEEDPDKASILKLDEKKVNFSSSSDRGNFIIDNCEQILETAKQLEELKAEFQAVTSYLADIQKLERLAEGDRDYLKDTAKKIIAYTKERSKHQNKARKITDVQFKNMARYEDVLPAELKKMKKNEVYQNTIKTDMKYLEGEKGALNYQREDIVNRHAYLKGIAVATCILVLILFSVFILVQNSTKADMQIPFLMTITLAAISALYIFINSGSNRKEMKVTELKLNKAIGLLNKVKIKYINNTNELDYTYQKYMVNSYAELQFLWENYIKAKEEERIFNKNMEQLEHYKKDLVRELRNYDLKDPDIWVHQIAAIIDKAEMDEVRRRLENRRKKLRERIDYNNSLKDKSIRDIQQFINERPENREEVTEKLRLYGIYL